MKALLLVLPLVATVLVSGCTGSTTGGLTGNIAGGDTQPAVEGASLPDSTYTAGQEPVLQDAGVYLDVVSVKTDKDLYHSAESMKLSAVIVASEDAPGTVVTATGINDKMSLSKTVDLVTGDNAVEFSYQLPRCNVCGGIPEGNYTCTLTVSQGGSSSSDGINVEIRQ